MENGDPNIVNEVLIDFLEKKKNTNEDRIDDLIEIYQVKDGPRCLRNYAKKTKDKFIL